VPQLEQNLPSNGRGVWHLMQSFTGLTS